MVFACLFSNQGNRNSNDGIALAQTIEGALDETTNMLQRIRTLAVQSANGTNTAKDRKALQEEVSALSHEITRIAQKSTFAGAQILDGGKNVTYGLMRKIGQTDNYEYFFQVEFSETPLKDFLVLQSRKLVFSRDLVCH